MRLEGVIDDVRHADDVGGFYVFDLRVGRGELRRVRGESYARLISGLKVVVEGDEVVHPKFGKQFNASSITLSVPTNDKEILRYLESGAVPGVGKRDAVSLVDRFGGRTLEVLETKPAETARVMGVSLSEAKQIQVALTETTVAAGALQVLQEAGLGAKQAKEVIKKYGPKADEILRENPYKLIDDFKGIGFKSADQIAAYFNIPLTLPARLHAGLREALRQESKRGHCMMEYKNLLTAAGKILALPPREVKDTLLEARDLGLVHVEPVNDQFFIMDEVIRRAETRVAERLQKIAQGVVPWGAKDPVVAIAQAEQSAGLTLAEAQRKAVETTLTNKIAVITGGPGTGKTTTLKCVLDAVSRSGRDLKVALCAPTGRAAQRMSEAAGTLASTIHRLLEARREGFGRNAENPLELDLLVIDEASMVDVMLTSRLLEAVPDHAAIVVIGDHDQLPSVGAGQVLADLIGSGVIPVARLNVVQRQAEGSSIVRAAHMVNHGEVPLPGDHGDFRYIQHHEANEELIRHDLLTRVLPGLLEEGYDLVRDVQLLVPMHRGPLGTIELNQHLQQMLNPIALQHSIKVFGTHFGSGDKVMQRANNYEKEVFNGDVGFIERVDPKNKERSIRVRFEDRVVSYTSDEVDQLQLAYCMTIHKSQGSEFPVVVMPLAKSHGFMLQRQLVYTGMTRARDIAYVVSGSGAFDQAINHADACFRYTRLQARLREAFGHSAQCKPRERESAEQQSEPERVATTPATTTGKTTVPIAARNNETTMETVDTKPNRPRHAALRL